ncbi:MAG: acetyl-CoA carboxylase carboxyl transferase subunit alpha, partial [Bacteroidota bacterium]|nr:acetyl-CoA carboxylase carboxyl transferase subunit alpha [Bacteroidota bacterium]
WGSWDFKEQAAEALKLTAQDLLSQNLIDRIVPEPLGGAHTDSKAMAQILKNVLLEELSLLGKIKPDKLIANRLAKFSKMGVYQD